MINNRGQDKEAYLKIRFLCNQAIEDALDWAWLDTCCINKDSSAELSEAINSMFRWYHRAKCCYAYLVDIGPDILWLNDQAPALLQSQWISQIAKSKWFTRGWTLQELLAPQGVKFYGRKWNFVGDRDSLARILAHITGIRESVLKMPAKHISQCSVAEKMSWAASRETSRVEDTAYCLLGLFEVNMPMLYGEGERAFLRLQEEIIRSTVDHSIFVWQPRQPEERHLLLAPAPDRFTHGNLIVTIPHFHHDDGYNLGNTGLRITLPLVRTGIGDYWHAILGCRYRDDYQDVIALCLKNRVSNRNTPSTLFISPTIAHSQRYVPYKLPQKSEDLPTATSVTVSRTLPRTETQSETAGAKYWFSMEESSGVTIVAAYPPECFNSQTLVMDLAGSQIQYGGVLVSLTEDLINATGYELNSGHSRSLAIVFGGWTAPSAPQEVRRDLFGIFGIVESNLKNLANACRFAVSRSIYRSELATQHHVAWVRSVYTVPWRSGHNLNVSFKGDRLIGMLHEVVNEISVQLHPSHEARVAPMPVLRQSKEPDGNPLGVERLQDLVTSWIESDMVEDDVRGACYEGPDPNVVYELEDDARHVLEDEESDDEELDATVGGSTYDDFPRIQYTR